MTACEWCGAAATETVGGGAGASFDLCATCAARADAQCPGCEAEDGWDCLAVDVGNPATWDRSCVGGDDLSRDCAATVTTEVR